MVMVLDTFVDWIAIVPMKQIDAAKGRLAPPSDRSRIARAMALDTVAAVRATPSIQSVVVVQEGDAEPLIPNCQHITGPDRGLNPAIEFAAETVAAQTDDPYGLVIVPADLPCLTGPALARILHDAAAHPLAMVSDTSGTGTTLLLARNGRQMPSAIRPQYGPHSCAKHVAAGAVNLVAHDDDELREALTRARRDVDTAVDLWDALRIGAGAQTQAVAT
jgi:2-phospho-L-lactate guanylyltransferase